MPKIFELCPKSTGFVTELEDLCSFIFAIPFLVSQLIRRRNRTGDDMHPRLMLVLTHFTIIMWMKNAPVLFFNIPVKNRPILIIFGTRNLKETN